MSLALLPLVAQASTVSGAASNPQTAGQGSAQTASTAFGLGFDSLLKIVLTQLTYQDPLKPMDNFQLVSQLAQFSQIQQGQVVADRMQQLVAAQSAAQATGLLGKTIDIGASNSAVLSGKVTALSLQNGDVRLTIQTSTGQTISNLSLSSITQIREGN